ncbi:MAG: hypothetical protein GAK36_00234 [Pseudomonas sp.]|nr:MAG: hypothetical protein GAK36_00234 [Pseudomonas sp.]
MNCQTMTTIKLSGPLIREFGREHRRLLDNGTTQEAFSALRNTLPGFKEAIMRLQRMGMRFVIYRNRVNVGEDSLVQSGVRELRIVPVIAGRKRAGALQTVIGAALVIAGAALSYFSIGTFSAIGVGMMKVGGLMALGGAIQMLSPQAAGLSQSAQSENLPSYAFGSAKNTTASGNPVPICYGERRWGGAIISASIVAEDKA